MDSRPPFFRPGGTMDPSAPSYIEREADAQLLAALIAGEYVFLLDSRQKGKSSMVARTIVKLREQGIATVKLDLQRIGANVTPEQWYAGMLNGIGQELNLTEALFEYWEAHTAIGPLARWIGALQEVVLGSVSERLIIFVDEIDFVRALPFSTDEFFAAIRDCYNRRSEVKGFERLTFCLVGVATPGQLIRNPEITPFNIGARIDLTDFTLRETEAYAPALDADGRSGKTIVERVHYWVNGHPYLTQLVCGHVAEDSSIASASGVDRLVKQLFFGPEARQREPNFADVERRMLDPDVPGLSADERKSQVLDLYGRLLRSKGVEVSEENPVVASLRLAGIGHEERGKLRLRNRTYARVFDEGWRRQSLPGGELRRQRGAARLATLRTAAVSAVILAGITTAAVAYWQLSKEREQLITGLEEKTHELRSQGYLGLMSSLQLALSRGRWMQAAELLEESANDPLRDWEWGHVRMVVGSPTAEKKLDGLAWFERDSDGSLYAVSSDAIYDLSPTNIQLRRKLPENTIQPIGRWGDIRLGVDAEAGNYVFTDAQTDKVIAVLSASAANMNDIDPLNRTILTSYFPRYGGATISKSTKGYSFEIRTLDGTKVVAQYQGLSTEIVKFLPDGSLLQSDINGTITRRNREDKVLAQAQLARKYFRLSHDRSQFACWSDGDLPVEIRKSSDLTLRTRLQHRMRQVVSARFSPDGKYILVGNREGETNLFEVASGSRMRSISGHSSPVRNADFVDDRHIAGVDGEGFLKIWNLDQAIAIQTIRSLTGPVDFAWFGAAKDTLVMSRMSGVTVVHDIRTGRETVVDRAAGDPVFEITTSNLFIARTNGRIDRLSMDGLRVEASVQAHDRAATRSFISSNDNILLAEIDPTPQNNKTEYAVIDTKSMEQVSRIKYHWDSKDRSTPDVTMSHNGSVIGISTNERNSEWPQKNGRIDFFAASTGKNIGHIQSKENIKDIEVTPDGKQVVAISWPRDGFALLELYDIKSGKVAGTFPRLPRRTGITDLVMDRQGKYIVTTLPKGAAYLWDIHSLSLVAKLYPGADVYWPSFSPDGKRLLTPAMNGSTTIWDTSTGKEVYTLHDESGQRKDGSSEAKHAYCIFSEDGRSIISARPDGSVRIWNSAPWK